MNGKVIIITGASAGLGKESALQLIEDGADVVFATRDKAKTSLIIDNLRENKEKAHWIQLDLCSLKSVEKFVEEFKRKFNKVDILMNNAGGFPTDYVLTEDGIDSWLQANHISHMYLTYLLLDYFNKDEAKIINLASTAHKFSRLTEAKLQRLLDNQETMESYYTSLGSRSGHYSNLKLFNVYFTRYLAEILEKNYPHIKTFSVHPGGVQTDFFNFSANYPILNIFMKIFNPFVNLYLKSPIAGAQTQLDLCYRDWKELENGGYFEDCALSSSNSLSKNDKIKDLLVEYSYKLLKNAGRDFKYKN
jgi:retinol dehydrogenase-12